MRLASRRSGETTVGAMASVISGVAQNANTTGARGYSGALARIDSGCSPKQQSPFDSGAVERSGCGSPRSLGADSWQGAFGCSVAVDPISTAVEGSGHRARHAVGAAMAQKPSKNTSVRLMIDSAGEMPDPQRYRRDAPSARGAFGAPDSTPTAPRNR